MATTDFFTFITALRGFHVYHNNMNWNSYIGEDLSFKCKLNNMHDKFAVYGKALLPGKIAPVVVGHVAKELSGHIWFAIQKGGGYLQLWTILSQSPRLYCKVDWKF